MYIKLVNCYVLFELNEKPTLGAGLSFLQFRHKLVSLSVLQVFFSGMGSHLCDRGEEQQTAQEKKRTCPWERCEVKHFQQRSLLFILWHKSTCSEKKKSQVHPREFSHHCKKTQQGLCWCHNFPSWGLLDVLCAWLDGVISVCCCFFYLEAWGDTLLHPGFSIMNPRRLPQKGFPKWFLQDVSPPPHFEDFFILSIYLLLAIYPLILVCYWFNEFSHSQPKAPLP